MCVCIEIQREMDKAEVKREYKGRGVGAKKRKMTYWNVTPFGFL